jgi:hypothetical protein
VYIAATCLYLFTAANLSDDLHSFNSPLHESA